MPKASRIRHSAHHPPIKLDKGANDATVPEEDTPVEQTISDPVRTKKAKQMERREAFMQKLGPSTQRFSKSHERRVKRKAKEQLAGNMDDLQTALASLDEDIVPPESTDKPPPSSGEVKSKAIGKIGKGTSSTLSKAQRKRLLDLERLRHPLIIANPDFSSNPFQTIRTHAQNTLIVREPSS